MLRRTISPARVALLVAVVLVVGGMAIASAGTPTPAPGGLSVVPAVLTHAAAPGLVGQVTLANTTSTALTVTVTPRPWAQESDGRVAPNRTKTLAPLITVSKSTFTLLAGASQSVTLTLSAKPPGGSLYGSIEAIGVPVIPAKTKGVTIGYRLVTSMRLDPATAAMKLALAAGAARVQGAYVVMPVRNTGNTVLPVSGSAGISNALGQRNVSIAGQRIVPGATVLMRLTPTLGLMPGKYLVSFTLSQNGHKVAVGTRTFVIPK